MKKQIWNGKDPDGNSAHHIAAKSQCPDMLKVQYSVYEYTTMCIMQYYFSTFRYLFTIIPHILTRKTVLGVLLSTSLSRKANLSMYILMVMLHQYILLQRLLHRVRVH